MTNVPVLTALLLAAVAPPQALEDFAAHCESPLWSRSLCGPMLILDPAAQTLYANLSVAGMDAIEPAVFLGLLDPALPVANSATRWHGIAWATVVAPLPDDPERARRLLLHEAWHREQVALGLPATPSGNTHLEEADARTWLRLEWAALAAALQAQDDDRDHVAAALSFRLARYRQYPEARDAETALELHEGLAEYSGAVLAHAEPAAAVAEDLRRFPLATLARSFAYASGPAWGLVLDECLPDWRKHLDRRPNFADLIVRCPDVAASPQPSAVEALAGRYGAAAVRADEAVRQTERERLVAVALSKLSGAAAVRLDLDGAQYQFDPMRVTRAGAAGTIYHGIRVTAAWGRLEADGDALVSPDYATLRLTPALQRGDGWVRGADWRIELADGYGLDPGGALVPGQAP